jgi:hypothetical protein
LFPRIFSNNIEINQNNKEMLRILRATKDLNFAEVDPTFTNVIQNGGIKERRNGKGKTSSKRLSAPIQKSSNTVESRA